MSISSAEANQRAETYTQLWNFANTYALGKHMSEQLVARYQAQLQLPIAVVRPSLVSAIAGEPYPGVNLVAAAVCSTRHWQRHERHFYGVLPYRPQSMWATEQAAHCSRLIGMFTHNLLLGSPTSDHSPTGVHMCLKGLLQLLQGAGGSLPFHPQQLRPDTTLT
jgi:hypothetical protein